MVTPPKAAVALGTISSTLPPPALVVVVVVMVGSKPCSVIVVLFLLSLLVLLDGILSHGLEPAGAHRREELLADLERVVVPRDDLAAARASILAHSAPRSHPGSVSGSPSVPWVPATFARPRPVRGRR